MRQQRKDCQKDEGDHATDDDHRSPKITETAGIISSQQGQEIRLGIVRAIRLAVGTHVIVRCPPVGVLHILGCTSLEQNLPTPSSLSIERQIGYLA